MVERGLANKYDFLTLARQVEEAKSGSKEAISEIYNYFYPELHRYFKGRFPSSASDLAQDVFVNLLKSLPKFDLKGDFEQTAKQFASLVWTIARNRFVGQMERDIDSEKEVPFFDSFPERFISTEPLVEDEFPELENKVNIASKLQDMLTPRQMETAVLMLAGKDINKIVRILRIPYTTALGRIRIVRKKVEEKIVYPAGFRRVADYKDNALGEAVWFGRLKAARFMGRYYTTDDWVSQYLPHRKRVDRDVLENGHLLLSLNTTPREYAVLTKKRRYRKLLLKVNGRVYIAPANLEKFRREREQTPRNLKPPTPDYIKLMDCAKNNYEYKRLIQSIKHGELKAVRSGNWIFVHKKDLERFRKRERLKLTHKHCPARNLP